MRRYALAAVLAVAVAAAALVGDAPDLSTARRAGDAASGPRQGGVLRVAVPALGSLDPAQARSVDQLMVADQLFDGLTAWDPSTGEAVPSLAARWQASPDQRQWEFVLRPGAVFANGRSITAEDVKYSLERVARPGSGSPVSDLLSSVSGYAALARQGVAQELSGVAVAAPDVVRVVLDQPLSVLPAVLASPQFGVVPREAVDAPAPVFAEQPVGSGPFVVRERQGDVLALVPSPGRSTFLAGLELVQVPDAGVAYRLFRSGEVDVAPVPPGEVESAGRRYGRDGFRPYLAELFYGFNLRHPKLADVRFREAIVRAVNRRNVVRAVYGATVQPLDGVLVEGVPGWRPEACARCAFDPARARALLAELFGGGPVPEVQFAFDDDEAQAAVARAIEASLEEVGIPVALVGKPLKEYRDFAVSGQQEVFRLGWIARFPSPDDFLPPLFQTGSPNNLVGFSSPPVDDLLGQARAEADAGRRAELYQAAEAAVLDAVPVLPVAQLQLHLVVARRVRDLELTSMGSFDASRVWLAGD